MLHRGAPDAPRYGVFISLTATLQLSCAIAATEEQAQDGQHSHGASPGPRATSALTPAAALPQDHVAGAAPSLLRSDPHHQPIRIFPVTLDGMGVKQGLERNVCMKQFLFRLKSQTPASHRPRHKRLEHAA